MSVGAIAMSTSTIIVALNAQLLHPSSFASQSILSQQLAAS
jgi:hypothetical protein